MKKIVSLLVVFSVLSVALCACGGEKTEDREIVAPKQFISADAERVVSLGFAYGSGTKDINTKEYAEGFAKAYNAATEFLPYGSDMNPNGSFVLVVSSGDASSTFLVTRVGEEMFNVSVNGAAADGGNYKFRIKNDELEKFIDEELMVVKNVDVACTVKFVLGAGTPAEDGTARGADETVYEGKVTTNVSEASMPTVLSAVLSVLTQSGAPDHAINSKSGFPSEIAGCREVINPGDGTVERFFWKYYLGDEDLGTSGAAAKTYSDGDVITVVYTASTVGGES